MATASSTAFPWKNDYPTTDGKPMAETDWHRDLMTTSIQTLQDYFAPKPMVYVSGNLLLFYERGNRRRHVSPDLFVVKGVAKHVRPNYLLWEERKGPDFITEMTSSSTRNTDVVRKFQFYRDTLKVKEYFLFDPLGDYLDPPLRGYRLRRGVYQPIPLIGGRLTSQVLGLHLERAGSHLRFYDPSTGGWLLTREERAAQAETAQRQAETAQRQVEAENERLRREVAELRRRLSGNSAE